MGARLPAREPGPIVSTCQVPVTQFTRESLAPTGSAARGAGSIGHRSRKVHIMTNPVDTVAAAVTAAGATTFEARKVSSGYSWPECPRWHEGAFWFSDMYTGTLKTLDADGNATVVVDATGRAAHTDVPITLGGFGWLPDGRLIVVSMHEKLLLVHNGGAPDDLSVYADLSPFTLAAAN